MAYPKSSLVLALLSMFISLVIASPMTHNVVSLGAKANGKMDSTQAFVSAGFLSPAIIYVPAGRFYLRQVIFSGPCNNNAIIMRIAGTLWLVFEHVDGVTISAGILDGQGSGLWACKASGNSCPSGATTLQFSNSNNIVGSMLPETAQNTNGIHIQLSSSVTILNSKVRTGDDCISIGPGTTNLWIENVACGLGHGISLGKDLQEAGVQKVTVKTPTFAGTENGLRIKNILFQHSVMINVQNPIVIDQNYCPATKVALVSGVKINDVTYQDIHGTSATEVAVKFYCSLGNPCSRIRLENVLKLTYKNQVAQASCSHAAGTSTGFV
ncbi:hypothetical protein ACJW31_04G005900 [Castanea mollissima]